MVLCLYAIALITLLFRVDLCMNAKFMNQASSCIRIRSITSQVNIGGCWCALANSVYLTPPLPGLITKVQVELSFNVWLYCLRNELARFSHDASDQATRVRGSALTDQSCNCAAELHRKYLSSSLNFVDKKKNVCTGSANVLTQLKTCSGCGTDDWACFCRCQQYMDALFSCVQQNCEGNDVENSLVSFCSSKWFWNGWNVC